MSSFGGHPDFSGQTIDGGKLNLSHKIGQGGFSVVYSATDKHGRAFAAKWLGIPRTLGSSLDPRCRGLLLARFDEEIKCHKLVSDHPNVVTLHRVVEDRARDGRWLVLDLYDGDLFDVLVRRNFLWQNAEHTRSAAEQIVDAVAHCHKRAVFHRDIKPENILCSRDGRRFVLADFGAATTRRYASDWRLGTLSYRAPEICEPNPLFTYACDKADVFALGLTLFNIAACAHPWPACEDSRGLILHYRTREQQLNLWRGFAASRAVADVLAPVLAVEPVERPDLVALKASLNEVQSFYRTRAEIAIASDTVRDHAHLADIAAMGVQPTFSSPPAGRRSPFKLIRPSRWLKSKKSKSSSSSSASTSSQSSSASIFSTGTGAAAPIDVSFDHQPSSVVSFVNA